MIARASLALLACLLEACASTPTFRVGDTRVYVQEGSTPAPNVSEELGHIRDWVHERYPEHVVAVMAVNVVLIPAWIPIESEFHADTIGWACLYESVHRTIKVRTLPGTSCLCHEFLLHRLPHILSGDLNADHSWAPEGYVAESLCRASKSAQ